MKQNGFTLIELLVVIAIIAVLSVVVVLSLNPAELLRQSRDANRLSDLLTLNSALALYTTDQAGQTSFSLGNASSVYISLPDSSSTCGTWSLPALPSGYTYACSTSTSSKNINNTGWIPVNFSSISGGAPFSILPLDGTNQSSTGLYYTYYSNGSQYEVTAIPESQKQKTALGVNAQVAGYPGVMANGSTMTISPLFNPSGLVGYWNFDERVGSTTIDQSGNGGNGTWSGTALGDNGTYYTSGKVGSSAGYFNGTTDCVSVSTTTAPALQLTGNFSVSAWVYKKNTNSGSILSKTDMSTGGAYLGYGWSGGGFIFGSDNQSNGPASTPQANDANQWHFLAGTVSSGVRSLYLDGIFVASSSAGASSWNNAMNLFMDCGHNSVNPLNFGSFTNGNLDDVRVYNRVLSVAEIQALYNAEK